jgi:hypothetical protein
MIPLYIQLRLPSLIITCAREQGFEP